MQLSPHFELSEFVVSQEAARRGINNAPSPEIIANLKCLAAMLEEVRSLLGVPLMISSGYRCPALNIAIGGAANSAHMFGMAADFTAVGHTPLETCLRIAASKIIFDQCIHEFNAWTHLAYAHPLDRDTRQQLLTVDAKGTRRGLFD